MEMPSATSVPPETGIAITAQPSTTITCPITSWRPGSRWSGAAPTEPIVHATVAAISGSAVAPTLQPAPDWRSRTTNAWLPMNATPVASTRMLTRRPGPVAGNTGPVVRRSCHTNSAAGTIATAGSTSSASVASASSSGPAGASRPLVPSEPATPRAPPSASANAVRSGTSSTTNTHRQPGPEARNEPSSGPSSADRPHTAEFRP
jgi:hypothetical protein